MPPKKRKVSPDIRVLPAPVSEHESPRHIIKRHRHESEPLHQSVRVVPAPTTEQESPRNVVERKRIEMKDRTIPELRPYNLQHSTDPRPLATRRIDVYVNELKRKRPLLLQDERSVAISSCDHHGKLIKNEYEIVRVQKMVDLRDEDMPFLVCSCSEGALARKRIEIGVHQPRHAVAELIALQHAERDAECVHAAAVRQLVPDVLTGRNWEQSIVVAGDGAVTDVLQESPRMVVVVCPSDTFGILSKGTLHWTCRTCRRSVCAHTAVLKSFTSRSGFVDIDFRCDTAADESSEASKCISYCTIPFPPRNVDDPTKLPDVLVESAEGQCVHGNNWSVGDPIRYGWIRKKNATLHYQSYLGFHHRTVTVAYRKTNGGDCQCVKEYDGGNDRIINLSNSTLVHYSILLSYLSQFAVSGMPFDTFWRSNRLAKDLSTQQGNVISQDLLRNAWIAFVCLLEIDYQQLMQCPECGPFPDTIILDGVALGLRKHLLTQSSTSVGAGASLKGSRHEHRQLVLAQKTRDALLRFATGHDKSGVAAVLSVHEYFCLLRSLRAAGSMTLQRLVVRAKDSAKFQARAGYKALIRECARNTPVAGIIPIAGDDQTRQLLEDIIADRSHPFMVGGDSVAALNRLLINLPVLARSLADITSAECEGMLPVEVRELLREMLRIYDATFETPTRPSNAYGDVQSAEHKTDFFPCWPIVRGRATYALDGRDKEKDSDRCTKKKTGHPVLAPGVIAYLCPHRRCYGYSIMASPESPMMPFVTFATRWPTPPKRIVYDNCCRFHIYCLNREPAMFQRTHFLVDKFHFFGHTACSASYDMAQYKECAVVSQIDSQACEQLNSLLVKLKPSLSYMRLDRFMSSLALFIGCRAYFM